MDFNRKVAAGQYFMEHTPCLCQSDDQRNLVKRDVFGLFSPVGICRNCGLIYANPRMSEQARALFYNSDEYRIIYEDEDYRNAAARRYEDRLGVPILEDLSAELGAADGKTVLEFGCGGGWNLLAFQEAGYRCRGIDYSAELVRMGRRRGLDLHQGGLETIFGRYHAIVLNHVLEHLGDPIGAVKKLGGHLEEGGVLYIAVPDMDVFTMEQFQNAHLYYFTERTLDDCLARGGFVPIRTGRVEKIHRFGIYHLRKDNAPSPRLAPAPGEFRCMMRKFHAANARSLVKRALASLGLETSVRKIYRALVRR